jgi:hypothetical protein
VTTENPSTRRWWAPTGLGALLCLGCCLAPVLIAAGVFGGGITLVSLSRPAQLGLALSAAGVIRLSWSRTRTRRTETSTGCTASGCDCPRHPEPDS